MKKFLPGNKTISRLFWVATLIIVVRFIASEGVSFRSEERAGTEINSDQYNELIEDVIGFAIEANGNSEEPSKALLTSAAVKSVLTFLNLALSLTSDFIVDSIYFIFTPIHAP